MLNITINGEQHVLERAHTVKSLLESLVIDPKKVALERNLEIVPRSTFEQVDITDGDRLEIVHFIGGG